jgi:hypothetical protein
VKGSPDILLIVPKVPILVILLLERMCPVAVESASDDAILVDRDTTNGTTGVIAHFRHALGVFEVAYVAWGKVEVGRGNHLLSARCETTPSEDVQIRFICL